MDLSNEQKVQVTAWVKDGHSLSEIQSRLKQEFGLSLTFMEVRFLIDDLDLSLKDDSAAEKKPDAGPGALDEAVSGADSDGAGTTGEMDAGDDWQQPDSIPGGGRVSVDVDRIQRPGAVMSGNVTFSDGERMGWQLDQMGRLGLIPGKEGYRPSDSDLAQFQSALQAELQKQGF